MENTSNSTKVTKRERFEQLMEIVKASEVENSSELVAFIEHEVELLNKKNSRSDKPTKTQLENEALKTQIMSVLKSVGRPSTVTQLLKETELADNPNLSNQKVSALLTQLRKADAVVRTVEKKVAFYSLADEVENTEDMGEKSPNP